MNYAAVVDDGVVLNKDGSLCAAWSYRGEDLDSASAAELAALSARVNAAFARRGSGWMLHVDALRTEARGYPEVGAFPDRTTALIDAERRTTYEAEGAHYESRYVLTATYLPPIDAQHAIAAFFVDGVPSQTVAFYAASRAPWSRLQARLSGNRRQPVRDAAARAPARSPYRRCAFGREQCPGRALAPPHGVPDR